MQIELSWLKRARKALSEKIDWATKTLDGRSSQTYDDIFLSLKYRSELMSQRIKLADCFATELQKIKRFDISRSNLELAIFLNTTRDKSTSCIRSIDDSVERIISGILAMLRNDKSWNNTIRVGSGLYRDLSLYAKLQTDAAKLVTTVDPQLTEQILETNESILSIYKVLERFEETLTRQTEKLNVIAETKDQQSTSDPTEDIRNELSIMSARIVELSSRITNIAATPGVAEADYQNDLSLVLEQIAVLDSLIRRADSRVKDLYDLVEGTYDTRNVMPAQQKRKQGDTESGLYSSYVKKRRAEQ